MAATGGGDFLRKLQKEEEIQQKQSKESRKPKYSKFSQQELGSCKPFLTPLCIVAVYLFIGAVCIPIGILTLKASRSVVELKYRYDTVCIMKYATPGNPMTTDQAKVEFMQDYNKQKNCSVSVAVGKFMRQPVYVYYEMGNYFQNHRLYVRSVSERQLKGAEASEEELRQCKPQDTTGGEVIVPCGVIAWSLFNDTFDISTNGFSSEEGTVYVNRTGIASKLDREERYSNTVFPSLNYVNNNNNRSTVVNGSQIGGLYLNASQPLSENEPLMVWMQTAALPTFRKLYGRIETDLHPGTVLTFNINNLYNTYGFGGSKSIVLSTVSWIGGKNDLLGFSYIVVGSVSVLVGVVFFFVQWKWPRPLGDKSYLSWVRKANAAASM